MSQGLKLILLVLAGFAGFSWLQYQRSVYAARTQASLLRVTDRSGSIWPRPGGIAGRVATSHLEEEQVGPPDAKWSRAKQTARADAPSSLIGWFLDNTGLAATPESTPTPTDFSELGRLKARQRAAVAIVSGELPDNPNWALIGQQMELGQRNGAIMGRKLD